MAGSAGADQSYTDPNGDGKSGTDIVNMTMREDTSGNLSLQIASASPIVANHALMVNIDADKNQSTGNQGDEYWMYGGPLVGYDCFAWNGSTWVSGSWCRVGAAASNITQFGFTKGAIGNPASFNFQVVSISLDISGNQLSITPWDMAPDAGYYTYGAAAPPPPPPTTTTTPTPTPPAAVVKPVISAPVVRPAKATAGKALTVVFKVTRSDNGMPLTTGTMSCDPKIAGKLVAHTESFRGGTARLTLVVPKTAKGKVLTVRLSITSGGQAATKVVPLRVG
jgi:hypothetical protein